MKLLTNIHIIKSNQDETRGSLQNNWPILKTKQKKYKVRKLSSTDT